MAGEPFLEFNDIAVRSAKRQMIIKGRSICTHDVNSTSKSSEICRVQSFFVDSQGRVQSFYQETMLQ